MEYQSKQAVSKRTTAGVKSKNGLFSIIRVLAATVLLFSASTFNSTAFAQIEGLEYELRLLNDPVPNRVHVLRVDLSSEELSPAVSLSENPEGDEFNATTTHPLQLAAHPETVAFINTNPWQPWPPTVGDRRARILGLAAAGGEIRNKPTNTSVWFEDGRVFVGNPGDAEITDGVGSWGNRMIVIDGEVSVSPGNGRAPRTAIGCCEDGKLLYLVVVDGRWKGTSEGMTNHELAVFMKELGCYNAANMDGGGSSIMGLDIGNGLTVMNRPSGRQPRPVPILLTIRKTEKEQDKSR